MSNNDQEGAAGFFRPGSGTSDYNALFFQVMQILAGQNHAVPVKVTKVESAGELALAGVLEVQPMVNQLDGDGVAIEHGLISGIPYFRMQGGINAIIMDPVVGDIGFMLCADKDISSVKANVDIANPGSNRRYDLSDGVYFGGLLNGIPSQYVQFNATGIKMHSPHKIELDATDEIKLVAPVITMNASTSTTITTPNFTVHGASTLDGAVHATSTIVADTSVTAPQITACSLAAACQAIRNRTKYEHSTCRCRWMGFGA